MEPQTITQGTSVAWRRPFGDYDPADGWSLVYALRGPGPALDVAAAADAGEWLVEIGAAATATLTPGRWRLAGFAERAPGGTLERVRIVEQPLAVEADLALADAGHDPRTYARRVLEAIEAVLEGRASKDQEGYTIAGRSLTRTPIPQLMELRDRFRLEVASEEAAARLAAGAGGSRRTIRVRIGR